MDSINDFLKGLNPKTLEESIKKIQKYAATQEGKQMISDLQSGKRKIAGADKEQITKALQSNPEVMKKLSELFK